MKSQSQLPIFDIWEQVLHWCHTANLALLLLTGFQIHSASFNIFGAMGNAVVLHFFNSWIFLFLGVWHVYRFFAVGKFRTSLPSPVKNWNNLYHSIRYYLFLEEDLPPLGEGGKNYNELQKLSYLMLFIFSGLQLLLGFALYWPESFAWFSAMVGGLQWVRYFHYLAAWVFLFFTMLHLYLVFAHGTRLLKEMIARHGR